MLTTQVYDSGVLSKGEGYTRDLLYRSKDALLKIHIHVNRQPESSTATGYVWNGGAWLIVGNVDSARWWWHVPGYQRAHQQRALERTSVVADILLAEVDEGRVLYLAG